MFDEPSVGKEFSFIVLQTTYFTNCFDFKKVKIKY